MRLQKEVETFWTPCMNVCNIEKDKEEAGGWFQHNKRFTKKSSTDDMWQSVHDCKNNKISYTEE